MPVAELEALLAVHSPGATIRTAGPVAFVTGAAPEALERMALAHAWGIHWASQPDTDAGHAALADAVRAATDGSGAVAVVAERRGAKKSPNSMAIQRRLGAAAQDAGHPINLQAPDVKIYAWLVDDTVHIGLLGGTIDRTRFEGRISERRAHFSPVSLHPRRAASLLHMARVAQGGIVYDPFCGTGGFLLEAALEGYRVYGSDRDPWMVQGSMQTLTDAGPEPLDADVFEADIGETPALVGTVDGIVTDLPYGRASGTDNEPLRALYQRALEAFAKMLPGGHYAVIGCAQPELLENAAEYGFERTAHHAEYVHKTLTRHFVTLKKQPGVHGLP